MTRIKMIAGKVYELVKTTPHKREASDTKKIYKHGGYHVRVEKKGRAYYIWTRRQE